MTPAEYKAARLSLGLTQAELAERLGIPREAISRRESNIQRITLEAEIALRSLPKTKGKKS